jgi:DNA-binding response OmpR family regulator
VRSSVRLILESSGWEVHEAWSGVDLLSALADEGPFDLVLTDVHMPWLTGTQVIQMVRAAGFDVPVVIMTAFADQTLRDTVAGIPGAHLLQKPFGVDELLARTGTIG